MSCQMEAVDTQRCGWLCCFYGSVNARVSQEEEKKRQEELDRQRRERRYILPDEPTILVNPNWAAKNGKFDCSVMSLSVLLDYRLEDNKEHSFEVWIISILLQYRRNGFDWMSTRTSTPRCPKWLSFLRFLSLRSFLMKCYRETLATASIKPSLLFL